MTSATKLPGVLLLLAAMLGQRLHGAPIDILEMRSVPDGNFLVNLQVQGKEQRLNFEVKANSAICVASSETPMIGLRGKFQLIGNGVFVIFLQNGEHKASQFWVFRKDGTAAVKEVPDRGEKQDAVPVKGRTLEKPK